MRLTYTTREDLAKDWAQRWNIGGRAGGWIYERDTNTSIVQGWHSLYLALRWLTIISPTGEITDAYATPSTLRTAYKQAVDFQRRTGKYL